MLCTSKFATGLLLALSLSISVAVRAAEPAGALAKKLADVKFEHYAQAPGYSEGPTWIGGEVFFCSGALLRVDAQGKVHKHLEIGPAGTVSYADGRLLICDNKHKALLDLSSPGLDAQAGVVVDQFEGKPLGSLNDLSIDARGNVYWTDPENSSAKNPVGRVFRLKTDGRVEAVASGLAFPNGLEIDPASKYLYVIESQSKKILRYELPADDGRLGPSSVFYDLEGSGGDGCAFDADGNLWVADFHRPDTGKGRITVLSPQAEVLGYLPLPSKVVSNIAFGGPNRDEIYCTTGDPPGVFRAAVGVKGFAGHQGKALPIARTLDVVVTQPHADADGVRKIAAAALAGKRTGGKFEESVRQELKTLVAGLSDGELRGKMEALQPSLELAAQVQGRDLELLAEVKRLKGKAILEIDAPRWLRGIAGDASLGVFARITELELNERTDGHKEPEPKALSERVTDDWLKRLMGQDRLRRLEVSGTAVTSAGMTHLSGLTALERLNVCLTAVDDEGLAPLAKMARMRRMTVCSSRITGSGFRHLSAMKNLESINLHSSPASDAGLEAIGKLPSLRRLEIVHSKVTDAGLAHIAGLVNLRQLHIASHETTENGLPFVGDLKELYELDIYEKPASNRTLAEVAKLPKLRMLRLFGGNFDDEGVKLLAGLSILEELTLGSGKVSDASIEHLAGLKRLAKINLGGTQVTAAGKQKLKQLLPLVEIAP